MWGHPGEAYGLISDMYIDTLQKKGVVFVTNGKFGDFKTCTTAFYCEEEKTFNYVAAWCTEVVLATNSIKLTAQNKDAQIELSWICEPNNAIPNFSIQKSTDGIHFYQIAFKDIVPQYDNIQHFFRYRFTDSNPCSGNNYYQIIQANIDETQTKSNVALIKKYSGSTHLYLYPVYPNPTNNDWVKINMYSPNKTSIQIRMIDIMGGIIDSQTSLLQAGINNILFPISQILNGSYWLQIIDEKGNKLNTRLLIKK